METEFIKELTSAVAPPNKFKLDDEAYELYTFDHLNANDEVKVTSLFTMFNRLNSMLERCKSESQADKIAKRLRDIRVDLIARLTSVPRSVVEKLPVPVQAQLLELVNENMTENVIAEAAAGDDDDESLFEGEEEENPDDGDEDDSDID